MILDFSHIDIDSNKQKGGRMKIILGEDAYYEIEVPDEISYTGFKELVEKFENILSLAGK